VSTGVQGWCEQFPELATSESDPGVRAHAASILDDPTHSNQKRPIVKSDIQSRPNRLTYLEHVPWMCRSRLPLDGDNGVLTACIPPKASMPERRDGAA
jgi:hypothetical protein